MKRIILGNRCDVCAFTVFFCLMMMFLFQNLALAQEHGQNQNPLLNWREDGRNPDDFEVLSLLPSGNSATEVDDGNGQTWTKTFIVPVTANATLTVVATPQPDTTEENLPDEWTLTGGTGTGKLSRTVPLSAPGKFVLHCKCGKSEKETTIYVFSMTFVTPAGDPTTSAGAKDSGDGQNEFTFDSASPGVLTMNLKASVTPASAAKSVASKVSFEVASIGNADPVYSQVSSDNQGFVSATATVTGLPEHNSAFGQKTAYLKFNGNTVQANPYEVFFPKTATNHPSDTSNHNWPNWMYYWLQTVTPLGTPQPTFIYGSDSKFMAGTTNIF